MVWMIGGALATAVLFNLGQIGIGMLEAAEGLPMNLGFLGKGNASLPGPLAEQIAAAEEQGDKLTEGELLATCILLFIAGQAPVRDGKYAFTGRVGSEVTVEDAQAAARLCGLNILAQVKAAGVRS